MYLIFALLFFLLIITILLMLFFIRIIYEYERGVVFTFGKYSGMRKPGITLIIPFVQRLVKADLRLEVCDVPGQAPITKDNVSLFVDAVLYFRIRKNEAHNSIIRVENYKHAIIQLAQTTMRNVIGEMELDEVLGNRDEASKKIQAIVDKASDPWGLTIEAVELKHVILPSSIKTVLARAAEAERLKRAAVIKARGEAFAAETVSKAAELMNSAEGGLNLRTLQELDNVASDPSNEVIFFVPLDVIRPLEGYSKKGGAIK